MEKGYNPTKEQLMEYFDLTDKLFESMKESGRPNYQKNIFPIMGKLAKELAEKMSTFNVFDLATFDAAMSLYLMMRINILHYELHAKIDKKVHELICDDETDKLLTEYVEINLEKDLKEILTIADVMLQVKEKGKKSMESRENEEGDINGRDRKEY